MAHWIKVMGASFKDALAGKYIDQRALDRVSIKQL